MSNLTTLPTLGFCSYSSRAGQYFFSPATLITKLSIIPQMDKAKRTVTGLKYAMTLHDVIETPSGSDNNDASVDNIKNILTQNGGELRMTGRGHGPQILNIFPRDNRDLQWGPICTSIDVHTHSDQTTEIDWSVEFITTPQTGWDSRDKIMEFNYTMTYSNDHERMTTRHYTGHIAIPMTRIAPGFRILPDSVDAYREAVVPAIPRGFVRIQDEYTLDESKTKLTFSVVDKQMPPNIWPLGVVGAKAKNTYTSGQGPGGQIRWTGVFEADFTLARGTTTEPAVKAFFAIWNQRQAIVRGILAKEGIYEGSPPRPAVTNPRDKVAVIPLGAVVSEPEVFGPGETKVSISLRYAVVNCGLPAILAKGGLWEPTNTNYPGAPPGWLAWETSVHGVMGPRGSAKLVFTANDEAIYDLGAAGLAPVLPGPGA